MAMTKEARAAAFLDVLSTFNYAVGYPNRSDSALFRGISRNPWMQQHPDLLAEFMMFVTAFRAEVEQRFEEQG